MKRDNSGRTGQFSKTTLAILAILGIANQAQAQDSNSLIAAEALDGVTEVRQLADGSIKLVFADGNVVKIDASDVTMQNGQVYITADALAVLADSGAFAFLGDNALLIGAGVLAAGLGIGLGVSLSGDDDNDPSEAADVLVGSVEADIINALGGDDVVSGLAGDDILNGGAGNDSLDGGAGNDTLIGGLGDDTFLSDALDTVDGGVGNDTLDLSSAAPGIVIDLDLNTPQPGPASQNGAILDAPGGNVVVEINDIENVIGTSGDDLILGNNEINIIDAGAGDDTVHTFGGADIVDGGTGNDTILFSAGGGVTIDLDDNGDAVAIIGGNAADTISNFENVNGSVAGDDIISGNAGVNILNGQGGNDILDGEGGADTLIGGAGDDTIISDGLDTIDGGEGIDTVDFSAVEENTTGGAFNGVIVDLDVNSAGANGTPSQDGAVLTAPPAAGGEPIVDVDDVENVIGSDFNDGLFGNNEVNVLDGGAGNDVIHGFAGDDFLQGGEGTDTVLFSAAPAGVEVDLSQQVSAEDFDAAVEAGEGQVAATGGAGNNVLSGFENVVGSQSDDIITGDDNDNVLNGNGGDDVLTGGLGNDTLIGGEGFDTADFSDLDVPVEIVVDAQGNGTATRDTGFSVEVVDAVVDGSAFGAGLNPESFVSEAVAGNIYFNIHTSEFTSGEIRGQLGVVSDVTDADGVRTIVLEGGLDAAQEPNDASDSSATGFATLTITVATDGTVTYSSTLDVEGIAPSELISLGAVSAIHLHNAPAGENGPVVQDFIVDAGNPTGPALPFSVAEPVTETDTLESIEEFILSDDNDSFISTGAGSQTVFGGEGDDLIAGGGGTDFLDGGEGNDTNSFQGIGFGVTANVNADGTGTAEYGPVNETFVNFENLTGSDFNDVLTATGAASNTLIGGLGDDFISGGGGADITDGGEGNDTVSFADIGPAVEVSINELGNGTAAYSPAPGVNIVDTLTSFENFVARVGSDDTIDLSSFSEGVRVDLDINTPQPGPASQDGVVQTFDADGNPVDLFTLTDFENITGTDFDDVLLGNNEINVIDGGAGNDAIHSFGGADTIIGGEGIDTALFTAGAGVVLDLDEDGNGIATVNAPNGATLDSVFSFENINGSNNAGSPNGGNDVLSGNSSENALNGQAGDDILNGEGGDDTLTGGLGDDTLDGGDGDDTAVFVDNEADITITDNGDGTFTVETLTEGTDTLTNIETIVTGDSVVSLAPSAATTVTTDAPVLRDLSVDVETNVNAQLDATLDASALPQHIIYRSVDNVPVLSIDEDAFALDLGSNTPPVPLSGSDLGDNL